MESVRSYYERGHEPFIKDKRRPFVPDERLKEGNPVFNPGTQRFILGVDVYSN